MKRRTFIKNSSLTAMSISAFGAIHWNGKSFVADSPTTTDILGPFYRPGGPLKTMLIPSGSKGMPLQLTGMVFQTDGKTPLSNALVEIWHCDENANYDNTSDDYIFRGATKTGKDGKYTFKTILPVPYQADPSSDESWRPAHIHMRVSSGKLQDLITQIYFKGDKYNNTDPSSSAPQAVNRILEITQNSGGERMVKFDVILGKELSLEESAYKRITGLYQSVDAKSPGTVEVGKTDDLLFIKWNGQLMMSLKYTGNNTFEDGFEKASFELLPNGSTRVTISLEQQSFVGEKFLKYPN